MRIYKKQLDLYGYILLVIIIVSGCGEYTQTPKVLPHQYPRVDYPERRYQPKELESCGFFMEIPVYAHIQYRDSLSVKGDEQYCWFDLAIPRLGATVHFTYYPMSSKDDYSELVDDAYTLASKHNVKASYREEFVIKNGNGLQGLIFKIEGPVATPYQFYITDEKAHFLRGSLYFNTQAKPDSLAPIIDFVQEDIDHLLASLDMR